MSECPKDAGGRHHYINKGPGSSPGTVLIQCVWCGDEVEIER